MTNFNAQVRSANVNVGEKKITVSFVLPLDDDNMEIAKQLGFYIGKGELNVTVSPKQMSMPLPDFSNLPIEK